MKAEPRLYVGTYAKYNSGSIAGKWLDLSDYADKAAFYEACKELHADEADPEFMFQDQEGIPAGLAEESFVSAELWEWLALDEHDQELFSVYREHVDQSGSIEDARDAFLGQGNSKEDWVQEHLEECYDLEEVPPIILAHVDWSGVTRELEYGGYVFVRHNGECWVFCAR